jgi:hypothetical protein
MVPVAAIKHLREFHRRPGTGWHYDYWLRLKYDIAHAGFEGPLTLFYNPRTGRRCLKEGNDRLVIAEELGMTNVPLSIYRTTSDDESMRAMHEPGTCLMTDDRGFSKFPQQAKPSVIGLPTADEPFLNALAHWYRDERAAPSPRVGQTLRASSQMLDPLRRRLFAAAARGMEEMLQTENSEVLTQLRATLLRRITPVRCQSP